MKPFKNFPEIQNTAFKCRAYNIFNNSQRPVLLSDCVCADELYFCQVIRSLRTGPSIRPGAGTCPGQYAYATNLGLLEGLFFAMLWRLQLFLPAQLTAVAKRSLMIRINCGSGVWAFMWSDGSWPVKVLCVLKLHSVFPELEGCICLNFLTSSDKPKWSDFFKLSRTTTQKRGICLETRCLTHFSHTLN